MVKSMSILMKMIIVSVILHMSVCTLHRINKRKTSHKFFGWFGWPSSTTIQEPVQPEPEAPIEVVTTDEEEQTLSPEEESAIDSMLVLPVTRKRSTDNCAFEARQFAIDMMNIPEQSRVECEKCKEFRGSICGRRVRIRGCN